MYSFKIRALAQKDIQEAVDYYDSIDSGIADRFLKVLFSRFDVIKGNPLMFSIKYREIRLCYLKDFPFGIHFHINNSEISVIAVLHTSRNPEIWGKR